MKSLAGALCVLLLAATAACLPKRDPVIAAAGPEVGIYRCKIERDGKRRRFKMLLFAERPDRLHAEALSPVGRVEMMIDGGGGRLSVAFPSDRVAFVGRSGEDGLEPVLGLRVSLEALVAAMLGDSTDLPLSVDRAGASSGLPRRFVLRSETTELRLDLKRLRPLGRVGDDLGRGEPPDGFELRELRELEDELAP